MDFQKRRREKYEEQRKELESSKTKMEGCTDENVNVKREIQEMRVSSGTGLINLENSSGCLELNSNFDNMSKRQERPHNRPQQSVRNRENNSLKEQQSNSSSSAATTASTSVSELQQLQYMGLVITAKTGASSGQACLDTAVISIAAAAAAEASELIWPLRQMLRTSFVHQSFWKWGGIAVILTRKTTFW